MNHGTKRGFSVHGAEHPRFPVVISVPHAGRDYPRELFENLRIPAASLVRLEDRYADLLARDAVRQGFPTIMAHRARAWIDLNRHEDDLDVEMVSGYERKDRPVPGAKQRGGLGLIPRRLSGEGDIWKHPFPMDDVNERLDSFHRPYHAMINRLLSAMRDRFGIAILLDLHSMPPISPTHSALPPRFVIGDRFGSSASGRFAEMMLARLHDIGFPVALNHPYSGDHILRHHGKVAHNIHALQLEVDRSLYLDTALREPTPEVTQIASTISSLAHCLAEAAGGTGEMLLAAE